MYKGKENYETVKHLMAGEECIVTGYGQSMTPILKSGQSVRCIPVTEKNSAEEKRYSAVQGCRTFLSA